MTDRLDRIDLSLDAVAKRLETDDQERAAMTSQLNRHEAWISKASNHLQVGYDQVA